MKTCPLLLLTAVLFGWTCGPVVAAPPRDDPAAPPRDDPAVPPRDAAVKVRPQTGTSHASLIKDHTGRRVLVINYPWKAHAKASVEVRLVTKEDADPSVVRPLFFVKDYLQGEVLVKVYHCWDEAVGAGARQMLKENDIDFEIISRRNSLGRPSVCVARKAASDGPAPGAMVVFCMLPSWSAGRSLLQLDLPREYFAEPGKLYVWFLRGERALWKETEDWPGIAH